MERIPQSTVKRVALKAFLSADHVTAAGAALTIPVQISKNGAGFANPAAGVTNATSVGSGWYYVDLAAADTATLGPLVVRGTEATIDPVEVVYDVIASLVKPVLYVSKTGNDANDGRSEDTAKLTIAAAVSAAAAYDTIKIAGGSYTENVDASALDSLRFSGSGWGTYLNAATGITLKLGSRAIVEDMRIAEIGSAASYWPIDCQSTTDVWIRRCLLEGTFDALYAPSTTRLRVSQCVIRGTFDAVNVVSGTDWLIEDSLLKTDCTWTATVATECRALLAQQSRGRAYNSTFVADRSDTSAYHTLAAGIDAYSPGGNTFVNCDFVARQANAGGTGAVIGLGRSLGGTNFGTQGKVAVSGGHIWTSHANGSGTEYSIDCSDGLLSVGGGLKYERSKVHGTIINLADEALTTYNLDHLCATATAAADMTTEVADNTILSRILANGDTSAFVPSTDGLQLIRDKLPTNLEDLAVTDTTGLVTVGSGTVTTLTNLPTGCATSAKQDTAQADLDIITGSDGVTLATAQALYAPAKVADVPTVAQIDTQLSGTHGAGTWASSSTGTGARTVTITVNDGSTAIEAAAVRLTMGATQLVGSTNASGVVVFAADDGTWSVAISRDNYSFTPTTIVVNGTETQTYSMTAIPSYTSTLTDEVMRR